MRYFATVLALLIAWLRYVWLPVCFVAQNISSRSIIWSMSTPKFAFGLPLVLLRQEVKNAPTVLLNVADFDAAALSRMSRYWASPVARYSGSKAANTRKCESSGRFSLPRSPRVEGTALFFQ